LEGQALSKDCSSMGRSFHADGPTTKKAFCCIIAKRARGTKKLTPSLQVEHPMHCPNQHWAAEVTKVRGGAVKDTTGN